MRLISCLLLCACGCAATNIADPLYSRKHEQKVADQLEMQIAEKLDASIKAQTAFIDQTISNSAKNVTNDMWPMVAVIGLITVVGGIVLMYWVHAKSYLRQKPVWLKRNGGSGQA